MTTVYTLEECKAHTSDKSCWIVIHGKVYDVTEFLEEHPGGYDIILTSAGKDATQDFDEIGHSKAARQLLDKYHIGVYEAGDSAPAVPQATSAAAASASPAASAAGSNVRGTLLAFLPILCIILAIVFNKMYSK